MRLARQKVSRNLEVDEAAADEAERGVVAALVQGERGQRGTRGRPPRADDRALDDGLGAAGRGGAEDDDGRGAVEPALKVAGEGGDPLHAGHVEAVAEVGRQCDDAADGVVGEAQEGRMWEAALAARVRRVGFGDRADDFEFLPVEERGHVAPFDDQ